MKQCRFKFRPLKETAFIVLVFTLLSGCNKSFLGDGINDPLIPDEYCVFTDDYYTADPCDTTSTCLDWSHPALEQMRRRAEMIGGLKWTPLRNVPKREGVFEAGKRVSGVPYSSVKELDKFIGQEVSFYTFLSAVNNPRSVLYSENVGQPPYNGKNCAAYYGSVCSMTVNYALGLERPYGTFMYGALPFIKRVARQDLEHAAPGDIVHFLYGHVILITDIIKDDIGTINKVKVLECVANGASIRTYSKQQFNDRLEKYDHVLYRYMELQNLAETSSPYQDIESYSDLPVNGNNDWTLSLSRGDHVTYEEGEEIVFNVLKEGYSLLQVFKNDSLVHEFPIDGTPDISLSKLSAGEYHAMLIKNDGTTSNTICFEVLHTEVSISHRIPGFIDIRFTSDNAIPEYIVFCNISGGRYLIDSITEEERRSGHKFIKCQASTRSLYLKVFFKGEYGRVSNSIIPL